MEQTAAELHRLLVDRLKTDGLLADPVIEGAFRAVPRHWFLPDVEIPTVYTDEAIPTKFSDGQAISSSSQPSIMAIMLRQLRLVPGQNVLEIGAGTGYNAALIAVIVGAYGRVTTVDLDADTADKARTNLANAGFSGVQVVCADGNLGYPPNAPYDRIILTVGAWDMLPAWWEQLKANGRLVVPLSILPNTHGAAIAFERQNNHLRSQSAAAAGFMPLRGPLAKSGTQRYLEASPGLIVYHQRPNTLTSAQVVAALTGSYVDHPTRIMRGAGLERHGLTLWLALHDPRFCMVYGRDEWLNAEAVPRLTGDTEFRYSIGFIAGDQVALLLRDPAVEPSDADSVTPIRLYIRTYEGSQTLAEALFSRVLSWDKAGRPTIQDLDIRVYEQARAAVPDRGEVAFDMPSARLIISWKKHRR